MEGLCCGRLAVPRAPAEGQGSAWRCACGVWRVACGERVGPATHGLWWGGGTWGLNGAGLGKVGGAGRWRQRERTGGRRGRKEKGKEKSLQHPVFPGGLPSKY